MELCFENLRHTYPNATGDLRTILDIPLWQVKAGQQILLRGVSGSGKTTLFNIASGLLNPTKGTVRIGDHILYSLTENQRDQFRARHLGYIYQNHLLLPALTALENVVMPLAFARQIPSARWRERAKQQLAHVGLADYVHYRPHQLSTGQRLRVAVARALVTEPTIIFADEPTAALDAEAAHTVIELLQSTGQERQAILVVASHDPALGERFTIHAHLQAGQLTIEERVSA